MKYPKSTTLFSTAVAMLLLTALTPSSHGAENLLINGDFELGPPKAYNYSSIAGWSRSFDTTYWQMTTNLSPAPDGSSYSPLYTPEGSFAVRRVMYAAQGGGTTLTMDSINYQISSFSDALKEGDTLSLTFLGRAFGPVGRFSVYATITFFDAGNTVLEIVETTKLLSEKAVAPWTELSATAIIPTGTAYFKITGIADVGETLGEISNAGFDNFNLQLVPEPTTVALLGAVAASGVVLLRRRKRS